LNQKKYSILSKILKPVFLEPPKAPETENNFLRLKKQIIDKI